MFTTKCLFALLDDVGEGKAGFGIVLSMSSSTDLGISGLNHTKSSTGAGFVHHHSRCSFPSSHFPTLCTGPPPFLDLHLHFPLTIIGP